MLLVAMLSWLFIIIAVLIKCVITIICSCIFATSSEQPLLSLSYMVTSSFSLLSLCLFGTLNAMGNHSYIHYYSPLFSGTAISQSTFIAQEVRSIIKFCAWISIGSTCCCSSSKNCLDEPNHFWFSQFCWHSPGYNDYASNASASARVILDSSGNISGMCMSNTSYLKHIPRVNFSGDVHIFIMKRA